MNKGVEFKNISKRYGTDKAASLAVDSISFEIPKGSLTTILGPSGCGKTTTLRMIAGLESPTSGQIIMDGKDVTTLGPAERNVSMMFQSYALFPHMSVLENVMYGLKMSGISKDEAQTKASDALKNVGLTGFNERLPSELSGGQQQRAAIARTLAMQPKVILFDEPTSALDPEMVQEVLNVIRALAEEGRTMLLVTHEMGFARQVSSEVVFLHQGLIEEQGSPQQVFDNPLSARCKQFMSSNR